MLVGQPAHVRGLVVLRRARPRHEDRRRRGDRRPRRPCSPRPARSAGRSPRRRARCDRRTRSPDGARRPAGSAGGTDARNRSPTTWRTASAASSRWASTYRTTASLRGPDPSDPPVTTIDEPVRRQPQSLRGRRRDRVRGRRRGSAAARALPSRRRAASPSPGTPPPPRRRTVPSMPWPARVDGRSSRPRSERPAGGRRTPPGGRRTRRPTRRRVAATDAGARSACRVAVRSLGTIVMFTPRSLSREPALQADDLEEGVRIRGRAQQRGLDPSPGADVVDLAGGVAGGDERLGDGERRQHVPRRSPTRHDGKRHWSAISQRSDDASDERQGRRCERVSASERAAIRGLRGRGTSMNGLRGRGTQ